MYASLLANAVLRGLLAQLLTDDGSSLQRHATKSKRDQHYGVLASATLVAELCIEDKWSWSRNLTATRERRFRLTREAWVCETLSEFIVCDISYVTLRGFIFSKSHMNHTLIHYKLNKKRKKKIISIKTCLFITHEQRVSWAQYFFFYYPLTFPRKLRPSDWSTSCVIARTYRVFQRLNKFVFVRNYEMLK